MPHFRMGRYIIACDKSNDNTVIFKVKDEKLSAIFFKFVNNNNLLSKWFRADR